MAAQLTTLSAFTTFVAQQAAIPYGAAGWLALVGVAERQAAVCPAFCAELQVAPVVAITN